MCEKLNHSSRCTERTYEVNVRDQQHRQLSMRKKKKLILTSRLRHNILPPPHLTAFYKRLIDLKVTLNKTSTVSGVIK